jgi:hypothetical protein
MARNGNRAEPNVMSPSPPSRSRPRSLTKPTRSKAVTGSGAVPANSGRAKPQNAGPAARVNVGRAPAEVTETAPEAKGEVTGTAPEAAAKPEVRATKRSRRATQGAIAAEERPIRVGNVDADAPDAQPTDREAPIPADAADQRELWSEDELDESQAPEGASRSERTALQLASAEQRVADAIAAYLVAKRAWADEMRRIGHGASTEQRVAEAQASLAASESSREMAERRVDALRARLFEERRRELLMEAVVEQTAAHEDAKRRLRDRVLPRRGLLARIFRRR